MYAFIFARGGSKGIAKKNIIKLCGKPLLYYSIKSAMEIQSIDKIFVSTEDSRIAKVAREYGANVINRPNELAQDDTPEWLAWQHTINWVSGQGDYFDVFLSLPTTSPLRNSDDICSALNLLDEETDMVTTMTPSTRNPYFNMVERSKNGYINTVIKNEKQVYRRQDASEVFDLTTVAYVSTPNYILEHDSIFSGRVRAAIIPRERAIDIDNELDLKFAEFLLST